MLQSSIVIEQRHQKFVETVCETQLVYGLKNNKGFAYCFSNDVDDDDDDVDVLCFWSELVYAKVCIKEDWATYKVEQIPVANFLENWCFGMDNDNALAGTNFNQNLFGFEIEPLELGLQLINEIRKKNYSVNLRKFESIDAIENEINLRLK